MKIKLNGESVSVADAITVATLLDENKIPTAGTAVAIDGEIIRNTDFTSRTLCEGDEVDILRAIGGG